MLALSCKAPSFGNPIPCAIVCVAKSRDRQTDSLTKDAEDARATREQAEQESEH